MATNVIHEAKFVGDAYLRLPTEARNFVLSHGDTPFTYNGWAFVYYECNLDNPMIPLCTKGVPQFDTFLEWKYDTNTKTYILFDRGYDEACEAQKVHSEEKFDSVVKNLCMGLPIHSDMHPDNPMYYQNT